MPGTEPIIKVGGLTRILQGLFGIGTPTAGHAMEQVGVLPRKAGVYQYHEGRLFTPGSQNYVLQPSHETPLNTAWGGGFLRIANGFNPVQPAQVYSVAKV